MEEEGPGWRYEQFGHSDSSIKNCIALPPSTISFSVPNTNETMINVCLWISSIISQNMGGCVGAQSMVFFFFTRQYRVVASAIIYHHWKHAI
jgi:hypothetical protein